MTKINVCSFIGHRKINITEELEQKLSNVIEDLIVNHNVLTFLFGSRSDFNDLCHSVVSELRIKYPNIKRIFYTCKSEYCVLNSEKERLEKLYSNFFKKEIRFSEYEAEFEHATKNTAGKASYVERNKAMIDDSDYCIFYYDENYQPEMRKESKNMIYRITKSGTRIAFDYAKQKRKNIINMF